MYPGLLSGARRERGRARSWQLSAWKKRERETGRAAPRSSGVFFNISPLSRGSFFRPIKEKKKRAKACALVVAQEKGEESIENKGAARYRREREREQERWSSAGEEKEREEKELK